MRGGGKEKETKKVHSCSIVHHAKFHCIWFFKTEIERCANIVMQHNNRISLFLRNCYVILM